MITKEQKAKQCLSVCLLDDVDGHHDVHGNHR